MAIATKQGLSERRACRLLKISRSVYRYHPRYPDDAAIEQVLQAVATWKQRWGFRKMFAYIRNQGYRWNHKRVYRVYRAMGLNLRVKPKKRLPTREAKTLQPPSLPNMQWSLDFMSDSLRTRRPFRSLNILDEYNREALWIEIDSSLPARRVTRVLDQVAEWRGQYPRQLRLDNGPEFIAREMARWKEKPATKNRPKKASPCVLSPAERAMVRNTLNSERFQDKSPYQVFATLLDDEQTYLCSIRTMYRILHENDEVCERRNQLRHPKYQKPELLTTRPNRLWSWDITKLRGPATWQYYHLYAIMDVFSRFIVGWRVEHRESARLAEELIAETCFKQNILRDQLALHADRGTSMTSKTVAQLLLDLGVAKTHSRPHASNDNPYSEAQFKTRNIVSFRG